MPWPPERRGARLAGDEPAPLKSAALENDDKSQNTRPARRRSTRPQGLIPIGVIAAKIVADLRRQRTAEHLHGLGPRPVLEALVEVEAGADLDSVLADFARLDPETVRQLGGDQFPPAPIHGVDP